MIDQSIQSAAIESRHGSGHASQCASTFDRRDQVACLVTVDRSGAPTYESNTVWIRNSAPVISSVVLSPESPQESDILRVTVEGADPDPEDEGYLEFHFAWR